MSLVMSEDTPMARRVVRRLAWPLRVLHRVLLRWQIAETEAWIRDCEEDGLDLSLSRPDISAQLAALRVRLALLED